MLTVYDVMWVCIAANVDWMSYEHEIKTNCDLRSTGFPSSNTASKNLPACSSTMRCNWYRQRPTQNVSDWAFLWMQHEKKLISHSAGRLWRKATSIELVCMRGGKLKYGLGLQMPASAIGCFGYGGWNVFSVCMCVSACEWCTEWRHWTFLHLCYFPITTLEQGRQTKWLF